MDGNGFRSCNGMGLGLDQAMGWGWAVRWEWGEDWAVDGDGDRTTDGVGIR